MRVVNGFSVELDKASSSVMNGNAFKVSKGIYQFHVYLSQFPTMNCQLSGIGKMDTLLGYTKPEDVRPILRECYAQIGHGPRLALVDVREAYVKGVEDAFEVAHKHPYTSTNGSKMCLFVVRFNNESGS